VCQGKGSVPRGFYLSAPDGTGAVSGTSPEQCRACRGYGYLMVPCVEER
jgi:DnaJ-class molecular chaperone